MESEDTEALPDFAAMLEAKCFKNSHIARSTRHSLYAIIKRVLTFFLNFAIIYIICN